MPAILASYAQFYAPKFNSGFGPPPRFKPVADPMVQTPPRAQFVFHNLRYFIVECEKLFCKTNLKLKVFKLIKNELIELQAETSIKSNDLWKNYYNYFNFKMIAARIISFFSSTYCCEINFSALQNIINKKRKQLLD